VRFIQTVTQLMQLGKRYMAKLKKMSKFQSREAIFTINPQKELPSQKSKCVNNLEMDHIQEIGVGESIGDVISDLRCQLAVEFTFLQNSTKTVMNR
jgi:hypothetical protein